MVRKSSLLMMLSLAAMFPGASRARAQASPDIHVVVNMVQLNVAVTDKKGGYVTGLRPEDFAIVEDGILEKTATFSEGNNPTRSLSEFAAQNPGMSTMPDGSGAIPALANLVN